MHAVSPKNSQYFIFQHDLRFWKFPKPNFSTSFQHFFFIKLKQRFDFAVIASKLSNHKACYNSMLTITSPRCHCRAYQLIPTNLYHDNWHLHDGCQDGNDPSTRLLHCEKASACIRVSANCHNANQLVSATLVTGTGRKPDVSRSPAQMARFDGEIMDLFSS